MTAICSIVIRAYNEERHLGRLLAGIRQQSLQEIRIVLVDSGSTDATVPMAEQAGVQVVHIRPDDFTFGRSLNQGIAVADSELVVIASAHVYPVYPDWLERLLEPLVDPQVGLSYGKQRGGESTLFAERQIFRQWYPDQTQPFQSHPFCNNANAAIRRSLWEQHPYDESLPGLEDLAWARWLTEQGLRVAYVPAAEVIHLHQETPRGVFNRYRREGMAFKQIYPQEQFHFGDLMRLLRANLRADLREAARQGCLGKVWRGVFWFRWYQFWGTYQGFRSSGPLTWPLKQAFYYPRQGADNPPPSRRNITPITYKDEG
ncbi:MAG: glycosyltransferase family 2 protein [Anaerolineaceae bacterium]|nr:glycosyltransferase family 2 protein [Anaerolineaceae bacterium]